ANPSGQEPAHSLQDACQYFGSQLNYLNGDLGQSQQPSRIINALTGEVIRP
ncbi:tRNA threonylcarbamoyladenosine biosynthesis protein RimN, partial [Acinetobacter baumannii]